MALGVKMGLKVKVFTVLTLCLGVCLSPLGANVLQSGYQTPYSDGIQRTIVPHQATVLDVNTSVKSADDEVKNDLILANDALIDGAIQGQDVAVTTQTEAENELINIVAVGDVMIGSWYPNKGFLPNDDARRSFDAVKPYLMGDVVFANLEGAIVDDFATSTKCPMIKDEITGEMTPKPNCYAFAMPVRYAKIIAEAGFNLVSIANNHTGDFGDIGRSSTMFELAQVGIYHAGLTQKPTVTFEKNGVKYGFAAFAPNIGTVSINDIPNATRLVRGLAQQSDVVIVSFHGGAEGVEHVRVPKATEMYLNENRGDVYKFSHTMIDAGADIVIGHGPHIVRAVEIYKDRLIAYSLGNFNTYGAFNVRGLNGYAPLINVSMTKQGEFVSAKVVSGHQTKEHGLQLDSQNRAYHEIKRLSQLDFPNNGLKFSNNGTISR